MPPAFLVGGIFLLVKEIKKLIEVLLLNCLKIKFAYRPIIIHAPFSAFRTPVYFDFAAIADIPFRVDDHVAQIQAEEAG